SPHTLVFYESPYRLIDFMRDATEVFGDRKCAVANDLTKKFETMYRGTLSETIAELQKEPLRGEYCVVIAGISD
ncbi:MAG: 16S rRNA (cytidine(1402)-2'-O)-methyltransferase, partial [Dehalobacter sp.]|nr:16S rRNA (cytidine(1402)-2'-O)-methyltransferase [Dehalobacter sp.]